MNSPKITALGIPSRAKLFSTLVSPPRGPMRAAMRTWVIIEKSAAMIPCHPIMVARTAVGNSSVAAEFAPTVMTPEAILNQQYDSISQAIGQLTFEGGPQ